jgi:hypothetical protein
MDLPLTGAWGLALRSVDLGVADGTTDEAARVQAMRAFGIAGLSKQELATLIKMARGLR